MRLIDADNIKYFTEQQERSEFDYTRRYLIDAMPTVEVPTWIPCSEKLPKNDDYVIITILDEQGDTPYRYADFGWYADSAECWIVGAEWRTDVIAWMPLPQAFKEKL